MLLAPTVEKIGRLGERKLMHLGLGCILCSFMPSAGQLAGSPEEGVRGGGRSGRKRSGCKVRSWHGLVGLCLHETFHYFSHNAPV